jgi:ankyrin repeat protein
MAAAESGSAEAVRALVRGGVHTDRSNRQNRRWTAMMYAAKGSSTAVVEELAEAGAHVNVEDSGGDLPIHIAVREGHGSVAGALLAQGAYVNQKGGYDRKTPLEIAVSRGDRSIAEELLEGGACVTSEADERAAKKKDEKLIALLDKYRSRSCNKP